MSTQCGAELRYKLLLAAAPTSIAQAVELHCLECMDLDWRDAQHCQEYGCALWPHAWADTRNGGATKTMIRRGMLPSWRGVERGKA